MGKIKIIKEIVANYKNGSVSDERRDSQHANEFGVDIDIGAPLGTFSPDNNYSTRIDGDLVNLKAVFLSDDGNREIPYFGRIPDLSDVPIERIIWIC